MARVKHESRSRVGIDWYDDEAEAVSAAKAAKADRGAADASIGFVQVGRDKYFDTEIDGKPAFAVVTP